LTGVESSKQHGSRLLLVWLQCQLMMMTSSEYDIITLVTELTQALSDINRTRLAGHSLLYVPCILCSM